MLAVAAHAAVLRVPEGERSAPPLTHLTTQYPALPVPSRAGCAPHMQGNVAACQILCDAGANVNYVCPRGQISCAHIAAANYAAADSLIEILHKAGADLNAVDEYGFSPLFYTKTARGAKMLCGCDADYLLTCKKGNTAQQHHGRNPQNGDAVLVSQLIEEYVRKLGEFAQFDVDHDGESCLVMHSQPRCRLTQTVAVNRRADGDGAAGRAARAAQDRPRDQADVGAPGSQQRRAHQQPRVRPDVDRRLTRPKAV